MGVTFIYISIIQGLALSGISFGDVPILRGWLGGLLPAGSAIVATLFLKAAFSETGKQKTYE